MQNVYEYARNSDDEWIIICTNSGFELYEGPVEDIYYNLYSRKIDKVIYDSSLECNIIVLLKR